MLISLALIFLIGSAMATICRKVRLPSIIGMLITGIVLGPYVLNLFSPTILSISSELRQIALIIILIKAGLTLDISDLRRVGRPAIMMSFIPASFEILAFYIFAPYLLGITRLESLIMGTILGAVSPAIVVPRMISYINMNRGTNKSIPQLILAGASCDDIFVIVLFSTFITMAQGKSIELIALADIPISIILGIALGTLVGYLLSLFFESAYSHRHCIRNSMKVIIILGVAFMLMAIESRLKHVIALSGLLSIISMSCVIRLKSISSVTKRLSEKFGKIWIAAELILFVLVGTAVDVRYTMIAGLSAISMIIIALTFRSIGVIICLLGTDFNLKERLFCIIAYLPKATVQAAISSIPLSLGLPCGKIVLSVAVLAIIITAPLGAMGMDISYNKLLHNTSNQASD